MRKNILVLTSSPRRGGNSDMLAMSFAKGAMEQGHEVSMVSVGHQQIGGCLACERCWKQGQRPCVRDDDMQAIFPALESADVCVLAAPLYFYNLPSQIVSVCDRLYPYYKDDCPRKLKIKESVLLMTAATDERDEFAGVENVYRILTDYLGWKDRGVLIADSVLGKGDIEQGDWLKQAFEMGKAI